MNKIHCVLASVTLSLCTHAAMALNVTKLTGNLAIIEQNNQNILVSHGDDGILLIDNSHTTISDKVIKAAHKLPGKSDRLLVIKTHGHSEQPQSTRLPESAIIIVDHGTRLNQEKADKKAGSLSRLDQHAPTITFDFNLGIQFNGDAIKVITVKGAHSEYDSIVYFTDSSYLFLGSLFDPELPPSLDLEHGGNAFMHMRVLEQIRGILPADKAVDIVPGSGPLASRDQFLDYKEKVNASFSYVTTEKNKGNDVKHILKGIQSLDLGSWSDHKREFADWVSAIYGKPANPK